MSMVLKNHIRERLKVVSKEGHLIMTHKILLTPLSDDS